jgi:hypothetical protein
VFRRRAIFLSLCLFFSPLLCRFYSYFSKKNPSHLKLPNLSKSAESRIIDFGPMTTFAAHAVELVDISRQDPLSNNSPLVLELKRRLAEAEQLLALEHEKYESERKRVQQLADALKSCGVEVPLVSSATLADKSGSEMEGRNYLMGK